MKANMSKFTLPPVIRNPNLGAHKASDEGISYDVAVGRKEKFITPRGKVGTTLVFSRVKPEQLKNPDNERYLGSGPVVKGFIKEKLEAKKIGKEKIERLFLVLKAQIEGNISNSSKEYLGANGVSETLRNLPEGKLVRFVDSANTEIPSSAIRV
jgi:hypothetical protein